MILKEETFSGCALEKSQMRENARANAAMNFSAARLLPREANVTYLSQRKSLIHLKNDVEILIRRAWWRAESFVRWYMI